MSDIRREYGHEDPWGEFEEEGVFGADALYCGDHEQIEDILLLTKVVTHFEYWADDFRYWDRVVRPVPNWEERSPFSELTSVRMADGTLEVERW